MGVSVREKKKGSGVWHLYIRHNGQRVSRKIGPKKKAEDIAQKIKAKIVLGQYTTPSKEQKEEAPTFKQVADEWFSNHVTTLALATQQRYSGVLKQYIFPHIGKTPVDEIKRMTVLTLLERMIKKGLSPGSVAIVKNVISGVMERAIDHEWIVSNPANGTLRKLPPSKKYSKEDVEVFTTDQIEHILLTCIKHIPGYHPLMLCAFRTGMRLGEILGLNWSDINWNDNYIRVQRSFKNQIISETKNKRSRNIDLSPQLKTELNQLFLEEKKKALGQGREVREAVFTKRTGERLSQNTVRGVWKRLLARAKYEYRKFHTARHSFASILISAGVPLVAVKEQMGHHSIQVTVDVYGQFIPSGKGITDVLDSTKAAPNGTPEMRKACN